MIDPENSVARLRSLAEKLSGHGNNLTADVLATVLGEAHNSTEFYRRVGLLVDLAELARKQVEVLSDVPGYERYVTVIDAILNTLKNLDTVQNWDIYLPAFAPRPLAQLEICEQEIERWLSINRRISVKQPDRELLDKLLFDIQENIQQVIEADLEEEVRQLLPEMLRAVERALLAYDISGLPGLRAAVERTTGVFEIHSRRFEESRGQSIILRTGKTIGSVVSTLRNVEYIMEFPEKVWNFLMLGE